MSILSGLFDRASALTLAELQTKMAAMVRARRNQAAIQLATDFRSAADRDRRISDDERRFQSGAAYALSMEPTRNILLEAVEPTFEQLVAFYCGLHASHLLLQDFRKDAQSPYQRRANGYLERVNELTDEIALQFGDTGDVADREAGKIIRSALRLC